jgi:hypothetical protein
MEMLAGVQMIGKNGVSVVNKMNKLRHLKIISPVFLFLVILSYVGYIYDKGKYQTRLYSETDYVLQDYFKVLMTDGAEIPKKISFTYHDVEKTKAQQASLAVIKNDETYTFVFLDDVHYAAGRKISYRYNQSIQKWECYSDDGLYLSASCKPKNNTGQNNN